MENARDRAAAAVPAKKHLKRKNRGPGRPEDLQPTDDMRAMVEVMAGLGIPQDEIVRAIKNPSTGKPISPVTLRRYFRQELDSGIAKVKAKIGVNILRLSEKNASAAIFLAKVRLGMKETFHHKVAGGLTLEQLVTQSQDPEKKGA